MEESVIMDELQFHADLVAGLQQEYTSDYVVYGIFFGEGDPEEGGQHWNFTRTLDDDDDGVCIVKEIQEITIYGGIENFTLTRPKLICEFNDATAQVTKTRKLIITFDIDDEAWTQLSMQARLVFSGESYFDFVP
jgi:hypothetical protein